MRTDGRGRRVTPIAAASTPTRHALFLGGSVTFGEGVEDDETMPAVIAALEPSLRPYNYGVPGYGAQHPLLQLRAMRPGDVAEPRGVAIYTFIDDHVRRAAGAAGVVGEWGSGFPAFELRGDRLVHLGSFEEARPAATWLARRCRRSAVLRLAGLGPPSSVGDPVELTAALIRAAAARYEELFPGSTFAVLLYPTANRWGPAVRARLAGSDVRVLDLTLALDPDPYAYVLHEHDPHPNPTAHRLVAEALVRELRE